MKTNLHQRIGTDPDLLEQGVWREVCAGIRVKVASSESRRYQRALRAAFQKRADKLVDGKWPEEVVKEVTIEAMATGLLFDWEGIENEKGKPVPFSIDSAQELLADPELTVFVDRISEIAQNLSAFKKAYREGAEKN